MKHDYDALRRAMPLIRELINEHKISLYNEWIRQTDSGERFAGERIRAEHVASSAIVGILESAATADERGIGPKGPA